MGGLHEGHIKLIKAASKPAYGISANVLISIFVNPLQFNANEDFDKYPRNIEKDISIAKKAGVKAIWAPSTEDIFPNGSKSHFTIQAPEKLTRHLCGSRRKGHFDGVATVVLKLLNMTEPDFVFFGEKDWQQLVIIKQLVEDFNLPGKIKSVATVRDQDGLAFSSRNQYLNKNQKKQSVAFPKILKKACYTTLITTFIFTIIYLMVKYDYLNLRNLLT